MTKDATRWRVTERDGSIAIVSRLGYEDVIVEWSHDHWVCSACGSQATTGKTCPVTCEHVMAVGRYLPVNLALAMVSAFAKPPRPTKPPREAKFGRTLEDGETERAVAASLAKGAAHRAARAAEHDEAYSPMTSPVTVRQATEADRLKLEAARERKSKTFKTETWVGVVARG